MWVTTAAAAVALCTTAAAAAPPSAVLLVEGGADEAALRAAIGAHARLVDAERTAALLSQAAGFGLTCDVAADDACAASFGQLVSVDEVVVAAQRELGGGRFLALTRVDVKNRRAAARAAGAVAALAPLVVELYAGPSANAAVPLRVSVEPASAALLLDGAPVGLVDGVLWTTPGPHVLEARTAAGSSSAGADVPHDGRVLELALKAPTSSATGAATATTTTTATTTKPAAAADEDGDGGLGLVLPIAALAAVVVAATGAVVWQDMEVELAKVQPPAVRGDRQAIGAVGFVAMVVGVGGAGAAGIAWVLE